MSWEACAAVGLVALALGGCRGGLGRRFRNAPALVYAFLTPAFSLDGGSPTGGFFRDGRASSLADVVAFLCALTDGFEPQNPSAYNVPAQCQPGAG